MIVTALILFGTIVVLPAGLSFLINDEGRSQKKKSAPVKVVEPEPEPKPEPIVEQEPVVEKVIKTLVKISPKCGDEDSESRLRAASLDYLSKVKDLPPGTSFEIQDCTDEGIVDIEIVEVLGSDD